MSGGHFDYQEVQLGYMAEKLEQDIEVNDRVPPAEYHWDDRTVYGYQHCSETLEYMREMVADLYRLKELLRAYDLAVSGDTLEEGFLEVARKLRATSKSTTTTES